MNTLILVTDQGEFTYEVDDETYREYVAGTLTQAEASEDGTCIDDGQDHSPLCMALCPSVCSHYPHC